MGITVEEELLPKKLAVLLGQWKLVLLWGARNVEALMIPANTAPCPQVLGCLPRLRYLELTLDESEAWLPQLFADLNFCHCLESLRITQQFDIDPTIESDRLPEINLSALPSLKRVELEGWFPEAGFHLPSDCELNVTVASATCFFEEQWEAMQKHLKVLIVIDEGDPGLQTWQDGFDVLSHLQYFNFQAVGSLVLDLADLKAILHVDLYVAGTASLSLSDGAWQSLQVLCRRGLCIDFTDAEAFVRGTERFLFISLGNRATSQPMCASIREACSRQVKSCYQSGYIGQSLYTVRLSNCEEVMRLEPSYDGKITPSGGLHDGDAGTPEDSPLWERLGDKSLVSPEAFWPNWEPHRWVFGQKL